MLLTLSIEINDLNLLAHGFIATKKLLEKTTYVPKICHIVKVLSEFIDNAEFV